ncbi:glycosyltransferase [Pseudonocardia sp. N23]|uniref:glycosyltransferase n=1 Tax=Pseudonocardia sp. N23 TaxID=1987376 RepID=UPI000C03112B|nr:glycosyltransferase [Pseudonocardia sp. N23]GAY12255.1 glycosyl transferase, group 1 [Pseudonocardia sp. N23]
MSRVRALFVAPNLEVGGAERQWSVLLPMLAAHDVEPVVLTLDGRGPFYDEIRDAGIETHCAGWTSRRDVLGLARFVRAAGIRADVLVARGLSAHTASNHLSRTMRVPYVVTEHTFYDLMPHDRRRAAMLRLLCRRADRVVALTSRQVPGLIRQGYRADRVVTIPNGVGLAAAVADSDRDRLRAELAPDGEVLVTLVAALRPEKRVADFVDMIAAANDGGVRVRGAVAGGGPALDELRARAAAAGGSVTLLGHVADVPALWAASDIACLTSESEVLSMSLLEAMSHGLPLVATDVGGNGDLCVEGVNGFLAGVGDVQALAGAVGKLAADAGLRAEMGAASARARATRFSADTMAASFASLLADVSARRSRIARR